MLKPGFRHKILALLVASMCLLQLATMLATLVSTEKTVRGSVTEQLLVAERTFDRLFDQRFLQLSSSVQVLVDDFGFRAALSSKDTPTIVSALANHAERASASLAIFLNPDGSINASTLATDSWLQQDTWLELQQSIIDEDYVFTTLGLGDANYQVVVVPVMAPAKIGWVLMGFNIDDGLAQEFRAITGLHISFFNPRQQHGGDIISTLPAAHELQLRTHLQQDALSTHDTNGAAELLLDGEEFLTRVHPLSEGNSALYSVLQKSLLQEMQPYRELESHLIMLFIVVLLLAVLGGGVIGGSLMAPVRKLAALAERIGAGNYGVEIKVDSSDEFGQLGSALNAMQQEIARREYRIIHQTQHDDLTDLPNRYLVRDRIESAINRGNRGNGKFTVVMLDISRFKKINDTLGHHVGDVLLIETARRLLRRQRKVDTVARMGGDDFLLLLENTDVATATQLVKNDILELLQSPHFLDEVEINVKFNCGFIEYPTHADSAVALLRRCEIALYEAKNSRSGFAIYEEGHDESHRRELAIVSDIEKARNENQLRLHFQPKLRFSNGDVSQAEALVRWVHPAFGFLSPDEFIPVLEQTGNINKLTSWVISEAARQCREWLDRGLDIKISVNLSALDLLEPNLLQQIENATRTYNLGRGQLVLEITESAIMQDQKLANAALQQLDDAGYPLAIDDFGTGYSSLAQLKIMPVSELKIDKSFVLNLTPTSQDSVIVKSTIGLAHSMNLEVVAEGIETEECLQLLKSFGCDVGQGYFISKPMAAADFELWYRNNRERFLHYGDQVQAA